MPPKPCCYDLHLGLEDATCSQGYGPSEGVWEALRLWPQVVVDNYANVSKLHWPEPDGRSLAHSPKYEPPGCGQLNLQAIVGS